MAPASYSLDRKVRAANLDYRVLGSTEPDNPDLPTFVLVHGIGVSHRYFSRLHAELEKTANVYSIDAPGFGGLPKPDVSPTVPEVAQGLGAVLAGLVLQPVILVGHSMGAQWVVEVARQRPELVKSVVAIGPVCDDTRRTLPWQGLALGLDILGEPLSTNIVVFTDYLRSGTIWFLREARHMIDYRIDLAVREMSQPLLVIRGGNDPIAGLDWCRRLKSIARVGSLAIVPGHRHVVQFTAPRAVASAIRAFVDKTS